MEQKELYSILRKILLLIVLTFIIFIAGVNAFKLLHYVAMIDKVTQTTLKYDNKPIEQINSVYNESADFSYTGYNQERAHTAIDLDYKDDLDSLESTEWGDGINLLIVGSDKKNFHENKSRADVIIVLRISRDGKILSISIPRDTLIDTVYRNKTYSDKIGHSLYWGGLDGLKNSVETIIGSPIYKVLVIDNFRSFEAFLSIIGGVSTDKDLKGKLGIQWIRNRSFKFGDIERCKRQQIFLKKAVVKSWTISKNGNIELSSVLFKAITKLVHTDLNEKDFMKIMYILKINNFKPDRDFYTTTLKGSFGKYNSKLTLKNNLSCWIPDNSAIQKFQILFYSGKSMDFFSKNDIKYMDFIKLDIERFIVKIKDKISGVNNKTVKK